MRRTLLRNRSDWVKLISETWYEYTWKPIEMGRLLIQCRQALPHGEFAKAIEDELPFGRRSAEMLMEVARHPTISNAKHVSHLPPSWGTLAVLAKLPELQFLEQLKAGAIHPELQRSEAQALVRALLRPPVGPGSKLDADGKYKVIYADPAWPYSDTRLELEKGYGPAEKHYGTMSLSQLCNDPFVDGRCVADLAQDDAVLFLWATAPMIDEALLVLKSWGFGYKAQFVWDKVKHNYGHYNSVRHELLLIATRGSCLPEKKELHDSVVQIERSRKHSEKPEYFRQLIHELYPSGNRIELFARKPSPGWSVWGNEFVAEAQETNQMVFTKGEQSERPSS